MVDGEKLKRGRRDDGRGFDEAHTSLEAVLVIGME